MKCNYNGVKRVQITTDPQLEFDRLQPLYHQAVVNPKGTFLDLDLSDVGSLVSESSDFNGSSIWTTTLTFRTRADVQAGMLRCFKVHDKVHGAVLIGTGQAPWPVVSVKDDNPSDPKASRLKTVTVTWKSDIGYLKCE